MTITNGSDLAWMGLKNEGGDLNHLTLAWADNSLGSQGPDLFKVVFLANPTTTGTAGTLDGLETMRILPAATGLESFFGIGDWFTAGVNPTERLDVLDGRVRVRQLPTDAIAPTLTKFLVVDDTPGPDFGVVKWRNVPPGTGGGCEWTLLGAPGSNSNIATAYNGNPGCPQGDRQVGIGTTATGGNVPFSTNSLYTTAKVNVLNENFGTALMANNSRVINGTNYGITTDVTGGSQLNAGIEVFVHGSSNWTRGVRAQTDGAGTGGNAFAGSFEAHDSTYITTGVQGIAYRGVQIGQGVQGLSYSNAAHNYAVIGIATGANAVSGKRYTGLRGESYGGGNAFSSIGVFGYATGATSGNNWAIWFQGSQFSSTAGTWTTSDESLKENIEEMTGGLETIMQLNPKTYMFRTEEYPWLNLSPELQNGLIAQEMQAVVPNLVRSVQIPAEVDSSGNEISPALDILAVKYEGLIPILIAAVKEQQATIAQMRSRIDQCCAANPGMAPGGVGFLKGAAAQEKVQEQRLVVQPNPFTDHTTLSYFVPQAGKVSLQVSTSDGKPLGTLREEQAEAGAYTYEWNTSRLASGTYFCTLMVDGNVVVKRAVKVVR